MLANLLAVIIGAGSLAFYLVAFILPEVHRRSDFFWSGVGMFYAVVLWYCARQMNGAVLLGQTASVGLLLWLGYQTLLLRRETTPAAQQTPIRLGKSERDRTASRPIAKDYEFVEDGVEDALDQEPDPDSPILLQSVDEFAPTMVVPAAIPKPTAEKDEPEKLPTEDIPAPLPSSEPREQPGPLAAVGIFVGWLKDVVTPKKKEPKPMIELPPRPPSIPKPDATPKSDTASDMTNAADSTAKISEIEEPPEITAEKSEMSAASVSTSPVKEPSPPKDLATNPAVANVVPEAVRTPAPAAAQDDEDSNWPEDEFWD